MRKDARDIGSEDLPTIYYKKDIPGYFVGERVLVSDPKGIAVNIKTGQIFKTKLHLNSVLHKLPKGSHTLASNLFFDIDNEKICHHFRCEFSKK